RRIRRRWWALQRSLLTLIPVFRWATLDARARACLAMIALMRSARTRQPYIREARRCIRRIARGGMEWSDVAAMFLTGGLEALEGETARAIRTLEDAETRLREVDLLPFAAAAQRRRGELIGGGEGGALVAEADAWFASRGAKRPDRVSAMLLPGTAVE